jgi:hypothetical protein
MAAAIIDGNEQRAALTTEGRENGHVQSPRALGPGGEEGSNEACPFTSHACSVAQDLPLACIHARVSKRHVLRLAVGDGAVSLTDCSHESARVTTGHPSESTDNSTLAAVVLSAPNVLLYQHTDCQ